ncbi:hypothetical protein FSC37_01460 [Piscinibacter aquaticus]|uniref:Uncharacterized protein n=1 Tax=Piscinibacter aquaticus TaxID=392597 RepID=A0A5C6TZR4_9BURK|nr:hypothetical protein FSC37_01460 [Piscinibacter aquaticus]
MIVASLSVALWWWSEVNGRSDLRPYLFVQFLPMLLVPAAMLMRMRPRFAGAAPDAARWGVLVGYALAKGLEVADHAVFDLLGLTSGHTLKHRRLRLQPAGCCAALARRVRDQLR